MKTWMGTAVAVALVALSAEGASERRIVASGIAYPLSLDGVLDEQAYVDASWTDSFTVMDPESKEINALYLAADAKFTALNTRAAAFVCKRVLYCCVIAPCPSDVPPDDSENVEFHFGADGRTVSRIAVSVSGRIETSTYDAETLAAGAARVELCECLEVGGLTPSRRFVEQAVSVGLPVNVLVRPRSGSFVFSDEEVRGMLAGIRMCRELGAHGVVIGALRPDGDVDMDNMRLLMAEARGNGTERRLSVTFHRAFDCCRDPYPAFEDIVGLGCDRLLTSGHEDTAPASKAR